MPSSTLSDISQSDACGRWACILGPYLEQTLTSTKAYTPEEVQSHIAFFSTHVVTWLGPAPGLSSTLSSDGGFNYPSELTSDHTPLEVSYSWKRSDAEGDIVPIARYVTDIIPCDAQLSRAASLAEAFRAIHRLGTLALSSPKISSFSELWASVTEQLAKYDADIHSANCLPCAECSNSSTFVGFDLGRSHIKIKLYWLLPSCQTVPALLELLDGLFALCLAEGHLTSLRSFTSHWTRIQDHISTHRDTLRPRMMCLDATKHPFPRLKLYSRCYYRDDEPFDIILLHLTLGGTIELQEHFVDKCRGLWSCLTENYKKASEPSPQHQGQRRYCMIVHEISAAASTAGEVVDTCLASKLYVFCDQIPGHDAFVTRELLSRFQGPARLFEDESSGRKFTARSRYIKEIGLAAREDDIEIAVYVSPCTYSNQQTDDGTQLPQS